MSTPEEFAAECKRTARALRRLPAELRRTLGARVKAEVAEPLAADIRAGWSGPYGPALSAATKTRVSADPRIVIGGTRRVLSGGASPRDLVFGTEFGGGKRVALVNRPRSAGGKRRGRVTAAERAGTGRKIHRRRTTQQFPREGQHVVFGTIAATLDRTFARWADVVAEVIEEELDNGS